ncbi:MAG: hypothetical protein ACFHWX_06245 [Bacteroidota bacterium]
MTWFDPKAKLNGVEYNLREFKTEGVNYSNLTMAFPIALGMKLRLNEFMNFNIEASYRITLSDYLDDVSTNFPTNISDTLRTALSNRKDEVGVVNQQAYDQLSAGGARGNPRNNDHYFFLSFKVEFFLPPGMFSGGKKGSFIRKSDIN